MKKVHVGTAVRVGFYSAVAGGIVGFGLGLLMAPSEGRTMRRRLAYQLEHMATEIGRLIDDTLKPDTETDARRSADAVVQDVRTRAQQIAGEMDEILRRHGGNH